MLHACVFLTLKLGDSKTSLFGLKKPMLIFFGNNNNSLILKPKIAIIIIN